MPDGCARVTARHRRIALLTGAASSAIAACNTPPVEPEFGLTFLLSEPPRPRLEDRFIYFIDEAADIDPGTFEALKL